MLIRDLGDGGRWFIVATHYPSAMQARRAWERCERKLDLSAGDEGIGLMRIAPNPDATGTAPSGAPADMHGVIAVTLDGPTARKAERLLKDGIAWEPTSPFADALILRRARIVAANEGKTGRVILRRPENRGAALSLDGEIHEQIGGDG